MKTMIWVVLVAVLILSLLPGCSAEAELLECTDLAADQGLQIQDLETKVASLETDKANLEIEVSDRDTKISFLEVERDAVVEKMSKLEENMAALEEEVEFLRLPPPEKVEGEIAGYVSQEEAVEECRELIIRGGYSVGGKTRGPYALATLATLEAFLEKDHTESFPPLRPPTSHNYGDIAASLLKSSWDRLDLPGFSLGFLLLEETDPIFGPREMWQNIFLTEEDGEFIFYEVDPRNDKVTRIEEPSEKYKHVHLLGSGFFSS